MSDNRISYGMMGELVSPISKADIEELREKANDEGYGINYEGTLFYEILGGKKLEDAYGVMPLPYGDCMDEGLAHAAMNLGLNLTANVRPFMDIWYDGVDPNYDTITRERFLELFK
ncbi:hypothetical protein PXK56_17895 [Phaeobacter gallaeciensis]|uniref:hypothetical protein n=1 Tax=Phaeobacter gallaeciensis TaxID=60890 RepID=UPI0023804288|nr:hypothetical protein [Phaeobacter gallaeciensis]MDE4297062.1 hypothetical protein [Phaeobacter gallaeciensis]